MFGRRFAISLLSLSLLIALATPLTAEDASSTPDASVANLTWLVGDWSGEKNGGVVEEQWSPEGGGAMMGMFRWLGDGKVRLYEFLLIETGPAGLVMRIKHFGSGLVGWEDKEKSLEFHLESLTDGRAVFAMDPEIEDTRLIYELKDDGDGLMVSLIKKEDDKESLTTFDYARR